MWFTCNRVCTAWVTGNTPSVADKHSENPMKYPILRSPRMMVMTANNVILPEWDGEAVETHTLSVSMHWYNFKTNYIKPSYINSNDFWQGCQDASTGKWHLFQKLMLGNWVSTCKRMKLGTSLVIQWLRLCVPKAGGLGLIPDQETRSLISHLIRPMAAK